MPYSYIMSEYEMKKALRKVPGAPKSYAEIEVEGDPVQKAAKREKEKEKEKEKESIFQHKNWALKEKVKLLVFLSFYQVLGDWNSERKSIYLYKHLSNFLRKTRTPEQCKNIHSLLKRKFDSIEEIVQQMQPELETEDHYERLLLKYQREIINFEQEHALFNNIYGEYKYEPISSRRATEKDEQQLRMRKESSQREEIRSLQERVQPESKEPAGVKEALGGGNTIEASRPDQNSEFGVRRQQLLARCNFHFKQWLLCSGVLEERRKEEEVNDGSGSGSGISGSGSGSGNSSGQG